MEEDKRYIYEVIYGQKSNVDNYEVIKMVHFLQQYNGKGDFVKDVCERELFAKELYNKKFKAYACNVCDGKPTNRQEVIGYIQESDGEYYIKTSPDGTPENNLEFLDYCKNKGIARQEWGW